MVSLAFADVVKVKTLTSSFKDVNIKAIKIQFSLCFLVYGSLTCLCISNFLLSSFSGKVNGLQ